MTNDIASVNYSELDLSPIGVDSRWVCYRDTQTDALYWADSLSGVTVYATPFWEGADGVPVDVNTADDTIVLGVLPLSDIARYRHLMERVLQSVESLYIADPAADGAAASRNDAAEAAWRKKIEEDYR